MPRGLQLLNLSKFGKEAVGSGLFEAFEAAVRLHKPLLTSVAPKHHSAWQRLAPDTAFIKPDGASIEAWRRNVAKVSYSGHRASWALSL